ncbi:hypothetical protein [Adhaeribacter aquaticus]|uniref:hypothetical protein n=1 Tax=Adhaeribacter aquaticus TaxID=299567 RepID=UPI0004263DF3|nr:hypothetical protein [Adhaeribacter aquaticus]
MKTSQDLITQIDKLLAQLDKELDKLDGLEVRTCMSRMRKLRFAKEVILEIVSEKNLNK